jgi:hypothetical protein
MRDTPHDPSSTMHADRMSASLGSARMRDRGVEDARLVEARVALLAEDLRFRLRNVCSHWDEAEFDALVLRIAHMKARWTDYGRAD